MLHRNVNTAPCLPATIAAHQGKSKPYSSATTLAAVAQRIIVVIVVSLIKNVSLRVEEIGQYWWYIQSVLDSRLSNNGFSHAILRQPTPKLGA